MTSRNGSTSSSTAAATASKPRAGSAIRNVAALLAVTLCGLVVAALALWPSIRYGGLGKPGGHRAPTGAGGRVRAPTAPSRGPLLSGTNGGLYFCIDAAAHVFHAATPRAITARDGLAWGLFCDTGHVTAYYPLRAYWLRLDMTGPSGKEVQKTPLGRQYGARFDDIGRYSPEWSGPGFHSGSRLMRVEAYGPYDEGEPGFSGTSLIPAPSQLFQMRQPGIYKLQVEMQLFRGGAPWGSNVVRFPPLTINVDGRDVE